MIDVILYGNENEYEDPDLTLSTVKKFENSASLLNLGNEFRYITYLPNTIEDASKLTDLLEPYEYELVMRSVYIRDNQESNSKNIDTLWVETNGLKNLIDRIKSTKIIFIHIGDILSTSDNSYSSELTYNLELSGTIVDSYSLKEVINLINYPNYHSDCIVKGMIMSTVAYFKTIGQYLLKSSRLCIEDEASMLRLNNKLQVLSQTRPNITLLTELI